MLLKISLLICIFLINLSTIQSFNVIMMKNLNENQLVNKLSEIANQGEYNDMVHKNVQKNSISVRSQRKRNLSGPSSEEDDKEENEINKDDKVEVESVKGDENEPISNSLMKKNSNNKDKMDAINSENSSETMNKKPTKRTKKHKKDKIKKKVAKTEEERNKPNIGSTIKTLWNTLRNWFRRNGGPGTRNEKVMSLIDDQNLIDVMKRIIIIMRASEKSAKTSTNNLNLKLNDNLRSERSGEQNDPLAPGKLPLNFVSYFTSTESPKTMWYKPNSFWNYWTYPKDVFTDNCKGVGLVQYGNLCIDSLAHK